MRQNDPELQPRRVPRQPRSRDTLDAIFEAMMDVLAKADKDDPSVQTIADRAGVSVGSLYQYFPSKQALASALLRFHLQQRMDSLERDFAEVRGMSAEAAAERLVEKLIGAKTVRVRIEHAMVRYFCRVGDLYTLTEFDGQMNAMVERLLTELGPQIRPVNIEIAAFLISNTLRTAALLTIVQKPERLTDPAFKSELTQMVVSYLKPAV